MIPLTQTALLLVFPALVILGAVKDAVSYTIPNWISLALAAAFPLAAFGAGAPLGAIGAHFGVGLAALAVGAVMFALRWIGGGDAKLFAAAALWLGWEPLLIYVVAVCLAGGGLAAALLLLRSVWLRPLVLAGPAWFVRLAEPGENVPYGVAIAVGALVAYPASGLVGGAPPF